MTTLDWIFVAVLLGSMLLGAWRGLVYEVLSLLGWIVAFAVLGGGLMGSLGMIADRQYIAASGADILRIGSRYRPGDRAPGYRMRECHVSGHRVPDRRRAGPRNRGHR